MNFGGHLQERNLAILKARAMRLCVNHTGRASNVENRQKPPCPPGCVESGLAAALRLAHSPQRGCSAPRALPTARFEPNKCPQKFITGSMVFQLDN